MKTILIDPIQLLALSILVLFLGMYLTDKFKLLRDNYIPPAVTGGLIFSLATWGFHSFGGIEVEFDMRVRDLLLLVFFSTRFSSLASIAAFFLAPLIMLITHPELFHPILVLSLMLLFRHRHNILLLIKGQEQGFRLPPKD